MGKTTITCLTVRNLKQTIANGDICLRSELSFAAVFSSSTKVAGSLKCVSHKVIEKADYPTNKREIGFF